MELERLLWTVLLVGTLSIAALALYDVVLIATLRGSPQYWAWVLGGPSVVLMVGYFVSPTVRRSDVYASKLSVLAYMGIVFGVHWVVARAYDYGASLLPSVGVHS